MSATMSREAAERKRVSMRATAGPMRWPCLVRKWSSPLLRAGAGPVPRFVLALRACTTELLASATTLALSTGVGSAEPVLIPGAPGVWALALVRTALVGRAAASCSTSALRERLHANRLGLLGSTLTQAASAAADPHASGKSGWLGSGVVVWEAGRGVV